MVLIKCYRYSAQGSFSGKENLVKNEGVKRKQNVAIKWPFSPILISGKFISTNPKFVLK